MVKLNIKIKSLMVDEYVIVAVTLLSILVVTILINNMLTTRTYNVLIRITHLIRI